MNIHLMGGDNRQLYLADYIADRGFSVTYSYLGGSGAPDWEADVLILPLPVSRNGETLHAPLCQETIPLKTIFEAFKGQLLFGGKLPDDAPTSAIDYLTPEEVTLANANLTAEGALALAIQNTPFSVEKTPILVLGAGRIGQFLALKLNVLNARVTVAARRAESLALCRALGVNAAFYEDIPYHRFPLIINTVPAPVLPLERLQEGCTLIELASAPGGFDAAEARRRGYAVVPGPGLPGRFSPETAAAVIGDYILKEMERLA